MKARKYPAILPCPFCGYQYRGKSIVWKGYSSRFECARCGAEGPFPEPGTSPTYSARLTNAQAERRDRAAIKAWNKRSTRC